MAVFDLKYSYFEIVNFPYLDGDVPHYPSYGIYILQLRVFSNVSDFNNRNQCLAAKLLKQGYQFLTIEIHFLNSTEDTQESINTMLTNLLCNKVYQSQ